MSKSLQIKISDDRYEQLNKIREKWNETIEREELPFSHWTLEDVISQCINEMYVEEFKQHFD